MVPRGIDPGFATNPGLMDRRAEAEARLAEKQAALEQALRRIGG